LLLAGTATATAASTGPSPYVGTDSNGTTQEFVNGIADHGNTVTAPVRLLAAASGLPTGYPINGIDVSSHDHSNGSVDWVSQRAGGDEFAFVKATEGTNYVNPYYGPDLGNAAGQANYFVDHIEWASDGQTLPPFLDLEWPYAALGLPMCYGLSTSQMTGWISGFLTQVQARIGRTPMIYTNANWWNPCTGSSSAFAGYPLDIASCNSTPPSLPGWGRQWTFWQYDIDACQRGALHDSNVFNGTTDQLAKLAGGPSSTADAVEVARVSGDFNGDGRADAVMMYRHGDGSIGLFTSLGTSSGGFGPFTVGYTIPAGAWDWNSFKVIAGDVNGDGRADLAVMYHHGDGSISMHTALADATGGLGVFTGSYTVPAAAGWDFNAIKLT
jgi:GH25 family lysozyme M1 (1,4-beta-N-acetylmuramidase)